MSVALACDKDEDEVDMALLDEEIRRIEDQDSDDDVFREPTTTPYSDVLEAAEFRIPAETPASSIDDMHESPIKR